MTTEERFTKIENALHSVSENQSRHDAAIRDLIVVSRTLLSAQVETNTQIQQLAERSHQLGEHFQQLAERCQQRDERSAERSAEIEEKLHALIEIVDRIIRKKADN